MAFMATPPSTIMIAVQPINWRMLIAEIR